MNQTERQYLSESVSKKIGTYNAARPIHCAMTAKTRRKTVRWVYRQNEREGK